MVALITDARPGMVVLDFCAGAGGKACQGEGNGLGEGQGQGARPEADDDVAFRDSQKRLKVGKGRFVRTGTAGGPNAKGKIQQAIQAEFDRALGSEDNPLTDQTLSKKHRENAQQYFDALREKQ